MASFDPNCVFCKLVADLRVRPRGELVAEFPFSVATLGRAQFYRGYCRLILKEHVTELSQLDPTARLAYCQEMMWLCDAMYKGLSPLRMNHELLGNAVPHLHWHCFPRYAHEGESWVKVPIWLRPEPERNVSLPAEERRAVIRTIQAGLRGLPGVVIPSP